MKCDLGYPILIAALFLTGCTSSQAPQAAQSPAEPLKAVSLDNTVKLVAGQTVYVPIYSHIFMTDQNRTMNLTATLSIRNTDLKQPMIVAAVNYYGTNGQLLRKYLEQPVELGSLAAANFVVNQEDVSGGAGAAFIVEWVAKQDVSAPVIEAVMINTNMNQGLSFISPGRVIKTQAKSQ
ncbi:MAG: DUF3124 domain-containing protein [Aphanocapsa sp. GSE-SYN-MK-11-07L]|jgi:hypothetical protein|nr:DUF3124 domain-containing protein [Aphanocapsa sp. GSE-SYN-MK-11-07L]